MICEGPDDVGFFQRLIAERQLQNFIILDARGNSGFARELSKFKLERSADYRQIKSIVLVADNDETPNENFGLVCRQVEEVFGPNTAPTAPMLKTVAVPSISILMIPWTNENGSLESFCIEAASSTKPLVNGDWTTDYLKRSGAENWANETRYGKAWIRSNLAIRHDKEPDIWLGSLFRDDKSHHLIPLKHKSFKRVADYLNSI